MCRVDNRFASFANEFVAGTTEQGEIQFGVIRASLGPLVAHLVHVPIAGRLFHYLEGTIGDSLMQRKSIGILRRINKNLWENYRDSAKIGRILIESTKIDWTMIESMKIGEGEGNTSGKISPGKQSEK